MYNMEIFSVSRTLPSGPAGGHCIEPRDLCVEDISGRMSQPSRGPFTYSPQSCSSCGLGADSSLNQFQQVNNMRNCMVDSMNHGHPKSGMPDYRSNLGEVFAGGSLGLSGKIFPAVELVIRKFFASKAYVERARQAVQRAWELEREEVERIIGRPLPPHVPVTSSTPLGEFFDHSRRIPLTGDVVDTSVWVSTDKPCSQS
ncbi:hypothetical protein OBBRIDRAFT_827788 [Obba rivulosa]|uniref:Uncharacterized protein n=1 Tax=Obba rivulosa TaxID=1052685 RepID=A0A8E2DLX0_9APHY|nr:hypothetical protein OBBRIDRAFT_827788 [Obba rivulosa]